MTTPAPDAASAAESIASLNSDGTKKWFIPPYVIPAVILALVTCRALFGT
ncbi:hypothetical protein [Candidatus Viadribacter manganicus]|nr:hypothetical protein [Candidatus Viadribacter manganicus]